MGVGTQLTQVAGTTRRVGSHLGLMAVARGWEGVVRREKGEPGRAHPLALCLCSDREQVWRGPSRPSVHISPHDKGRKYPHYSQKDEGGAKRKNKGREAQKRCLLKQPLQLTAGMSTRHSQEQRAHGEGTRGLSLSEHHLQLAVQAARVHCSPFPASPATGNTPERKAQAGGGRGWREMKTRLPDAPAAERSLTEK